DLDFFKAINDLWGHDAGNLVLRHVARQLAHTCSGFGAAVPVRLHGDEFAVLLTGLPLGAAGVELAEQRAHELAVVIGTLVTFGVDQLAVTGSTDVAVSPAWHADLSALLRAADQRMYAHKRRACVDADVSTTAGPVGRWSA
ncbi:MAG: GGDEF domain-containing protein, partial [Thermocrispum sp.]